MNSLPPAGRRTQIIATLGPASSTVETITELVAAGVDVVRLNFSHAGHDEVAEFVQRIRQVPASAGRSPAVLADLQGPKLRIGDLPAPLQLREGAALVLTRTQEGPSGVTAPGELFSDAVTPGTRIFLKDGLLELRVESRSDSQIRTVVEAGGELTGRAGISIPQLDLRLPVPTDQDRHDLEFAVRQGIGWIALSFVSGPEDIARARTLLRSLGASDVRLVAKIERRAALLAFEAIAEAADALMVARGDLGVEVGVEEVPIWQHRIIAAGASRGVPVIVATEMLETMRSRERPTRAEVSDVAHAVWDGADALMLSAETAIGDFPVQTVTMMDRIIRRAESASGGERGPHQPVQSR